METMLHHLLHMKDQIHIWLVLAASLSQPATILPTQMDSLILLILMSTLGFVKMPALLKF